MDFFPHRAPVTNIASATSASLTPSATYLANTPSTIVNTVSLALNISGSGGTSGTSFSVAGAQGAQGASGTKGNRGKNIYLLAATRSPNYPGSSCLNYTLYDTGPSDRQCCDDQGSGVYYATGSIGTWQVGTPIYTDAGCTNTVKRGLTVHAGLGDVITVSAGKISNIESCLFYCGNNA